MSLPPGLINLDHYTAAAQAMSEMDEHKAQMDASRQVSQKVNMLGHGGLIRKKIADFANVRDDVRASAVPKRKRRDAHDFRNDLVNSFVPDYGYNVSDGTAFGDGMTLIEHGTHQPRFLDNMGLIFLSSPDIDPKFHKATLISQTKKKKRKHENDPGYRGY